jgi:hypothetical protein
LEGVETGIADYFFVGFDCSSGDLRRYFVNMTVSAIDIAIGFEFEGFLDV